MSKTYTVLVTLMSLGCFAYCWYHIITTYSIRDKLMADALLCVEVNPEFKEQYLDCQKVEYSYVCVKASYEVMCKEPDQPKF